MGIKKAIKNVVGPEMYSKLRVVKSNIKYFRAMQNASKLVIQSNKWEHFLTLSKPGKHLFFGYYDIKQFNYDETKVLVTEIPVGADPLKSKALLQTYSLETGEYNVIGETAAWCWQQGARLRWHPTMPQCVVYNDVEDGKYVARLVDAENDKRLKTYPRALYDISSDGRIGLSLNYSRLQRLRPGYGYSILPELSKDAFVPEEDGIFSVDLESDEVKRIISLKQLVMLSPESEKMWNYINHISFSPNGKLFMFFHLWTIASGARWKNKLYVANVDGSGLHCLESDEVISHYCWISDDELLATTVGFDDPIKKFIVYDIKNHTKRILKSEHLTKDGHPAMMGDKVHFISDTYPQSDCMQHLFIESIDRSGADYEPICTVFSDPRMFGDKRCDMHSRFSITDQYITFDSTFQNKQRSIVILKMNNR